MVQVDVCTISIFFKLWVYINDLTEYRAIIQKSKFLSIEAPQADR